MSPFSFATATKSSEQSCIEGYYQTGDENLTLKELRTLCNFDKGNEKAIEVSPLQPTQNLARNFGVISQRITNERSTEFEPYIITPHKINYFLPVISTNAINKKAYQTKNGYEENLEDIEAKFQLSIKVPLNSHSMFIDGDGLYAGFTIEAWWQIYASGISKPFRETNYQPEIFYMAPFNWHPFGGNTGFVVGIEHQSNGRGQNLSRSWNRLYSHFLFEKDNFAFSLKPWVRLSEDDKEYEFDPNGDDNPDIQDYMGNFELGMVYKWEDVELSFKGRQNFSTNNGAAELGITFPLFKRLRGYATAFNGYGESLIDYNYSQTRFGLGISLTNVL